VTILLTLFNILFWVILIALAGLFILVFAGLKRRKRDRALKLLDSFNVTLEWEDGTRRTGVMRALGDSVMLTFDDAPQTSTTWLHYAPEWDLVTGVYRFNDNLNEHDLSRRMAQVKALQKAASLPKQAHPGKWLDKIADQALAVWAGLTRRPFPEPAYRAVTTDTQHLLAGYAGDAHNALLEMLLGKAVVVQHVARGRIHQRSGVLLAYSHRFLFLVNVPVLQIITIKFEQGDKEDQHLNLKWRWQNNQLEIRNLGLFPLLLDQILVGDVVRDLSMMIEPNSAFSLHIKRPARENVRLIARIMREADIVLPRNKAVVRFGVKASGQLPLLDIARLLPTSAASEDEEQRLRRELKQHPLNPAAAATLARQLVEKGRISEAERFYEMALSDARHLPDKGQRVQLELSYLRFDQRGEGEKTS